MSLWLRQSCFRVFVISKLLAYMPPGPSQYKIKKKVECHGFVHPLIMLQECVVDGMPNILTVGLNRLLFIYFNGCIEAEMMLMITWHPRDPIVTRWGQLYWVRFCWDVDIANYWYLFLDYAEFFGYKLERNIITLSMVQLPDNILEENTFLNLRVVASTNRTSVSTMVTLEIVKDDSVTPVFGSAVYEGLYDTADGLSLERIVLVQGYDETVRVSLQGGTYLNIYAIHHCWYFL